MCAQSSSLFDKLSEARALHALFQPVISVPSLCIHGYEGFIRGPVDSELHAPIKLFAMALQEHRLAQLDLLSQSLILKQFAMQGLQGVLFLNTSAHVATDQQALHGNVLQCVQKSGLNPAQIVIEITEHYPLQDEQILKDTVCYYRKMGFAIALDDLGMGYGGIRLWSEIRPEYVKIDMHYVQNIHLDPLKRQFLHAICEITHDLGIDLVAEGVESMAEYEVIKGLNIPFAQGYHFARPALEPLHHLVNPTASYPDQQLNSNLSTGQTVAALLRHNTTIRPGLTLRETIELFQRDPVLHCLPIVLDDQPVGIVRRNDLFMLYARRFMRELHDRRPIRFFMRSDVLIVSEEDSLESLSQAITASGQDNIAEDFIIVNKQGFYLGIGLLVDLLRKITALQISYARYANPLTQLPGNVPINDHLNTMLQQNVDFAVAYCDLDYFKPFNDYYGYAKGDDVIRSLGTLLQAVVRYEQEFIGHVGGDDFVLILLGSRPELRCQQVLEQFAALAPGFYDAPERKAGGILAVDRLGQSRFFPLLSLSIGLTLVTAGQFQSHLDISKRASEVKHLAKQNAGNSLFIDRRECACLPVSS